MSSLQPYDPQTALLIQGTISAVAIINEIFAVILSKKAFDWAGETGQRKKVNELKYPPLRKLLLKGGYLFILYCY